MPLPKAPTKRASRLDNAAFSDSLAVSKPNTSRQTPAAEPAPKAPLLKLASSPKPAALFAPSPAAKLPEKQPDLTAVAPAAGPRLDRSPSRKTPKKRSTGVAKLFVLDTNVLMHDPMSLFRFCLLYTSDAADE